MYFEGRKRNVADVNKNWCKRAPGNLQAIGIPGTYGLHS
nr:MAG TPA: hypothetical protein [Caudoviricetes sp.]DAW11742.1 MAG TPA: hypothetical protein [Caudoviricetes sp.]